MGVIKLIWERSWSSVCHFWLLPSDRRGLHSFISSLWKMIDTVLMTYCNAWDLLLKCRQKQSQSKCYSNHFLCSSRKLCFDF